jgi:penicillin G amidase
VNPTPQTVVELGAPLAQGRTAAIYAWGPGQVVKLYFPQFAGESVQREASLARQVQATGLRVPAVGDVVRVAERPGIVYERVDGVSLLRIWLAHPWRWAAVGRQLAELHAAMHHHPGSGLPNQRQRLHRRIAEAAPLSAALRRQALAVLATLPDAALLCHGDFHPDNVLVTATDPVIIDWLDATAGQPLADVARTVVLLRFGSYYQPSHTRWLARLLLARLEQAYLRRYRQLRPYAPAELFVLLVIILLAVGGFLFYLYWWQIQRCVPPLDGELDFAGLNQPVEIRRDKHGIPHLYAQNRADLFRAQGFVHAQDRLWQMEQNRRIARGTLAEVFGEAALDADRFSRIIGFWRAAQQELAQLDAETRQILDWYAEGVNRWIEARPGRLAAEFNLLRVKPESWSALDTIGYAKVMAWALSLNWESELTRLQLLQQLDPVAAAELDPDYPAKNPIILEGVGGETTTRLLSTAGLLLNQYEQLKGWLGVQQGGHGSNSWVLAPKASLNRRPLLCNDPHLAIAIPNVWYENHLVCPDLEVSGVSFPGAPGVVIGHNAEIAWGVTNAFVDVQDLYLEQPHPDDPTRFAYNGEWEEAQVIDEQINIRRRAPHIERVIITRHGPLLDALINQAAPHLALRWSGAEPGQSVRALLRLNRATDWDEFCAALADWSTPPQNFTFADVRGNIGYLLAGWVPQRTGNPGLTPAPGWSDEFEWGGPVPFAELPRLYNPPSGKIVTANNKPLGDDSPHFLGVDFDPGWRAARLEERLNEKERYTIRDMEEIQLDTVSKFAQALTPWLTLIGSEDPWEKAALAALRKWNFRMETDGEAPTVFHYLLNTLFELVYGDKLGPAKAGYYGIGSAPLFHSFGFYQRAETHLLELLNNHEHSIWYLDVAASRQRNREELLQEALTRAVKLLRQHTGDVTRLWSWGRLHQLRYVHPLGSVRLLRDLFNRGPFPVSGDVYTPNVTRQTPQLPPGLVQVVATYRQIYEVGSWDRAQTVNSVGQSGHPLSPHYDDQIVLWREGVYHAMPWSEEAVRQATAYRLTLRPRLGD